MPAKEFRKGQACDKNEVVIKNRLIAINQAMRLLQSDGGFKLYMYLATNTQDYVLNLSNVAFTDATGIGRTSYETAFEELFYYGYLTLEEKNRYIFKDYVEEPTEAKIKRYKKDVARLYYLSQSGAE